MREKKYEKFSEEELKDILTNSLTFSECLRKLGYSTGNSKVIKEIAQKYNINISHLGRLHDLTGQKFGKLTVIKRDMSKIEGKVYWLCRCECGNFTSVRASHLTDKNNPTLSCGCLIRETAKQLCENKLIDLTNQQFGELTVLNRAYPNKDKKRVYWNCRCSCGREVIVRGDTLKNQISCGHSTISSGELLIAKLLSNMQIPFETQKTFNNLKDKSYLKLDFFLTDKNIAIEYQGEQHYESIDFFGGKERLEIQISHDNIKREYCQQNNIKLIEIPYWDYDKLNEEYLLDLIND